MRGGQATRGKCEGRTCHMEAIMRGGHTTRGLFAFHVYAFSVHGCVWAYVYVGTCIHAYTCMWELEAEGRCFSLSFSSLLLEPKAH